MTRQRVGLRAPVPGDGAVVRTTSRRRPLWRACDHRRSGPWWFSTRTGNNDPGRFDLTAPRGTAYWALSPSAAILEKTADPVAAEPTVVSVAALGRLKVWRADHVPGARSKLADTTTASVPGLTAELATVVPYDLPWRWADEFDRAGRSGIIYLARFAASEVVALFGQAGLVDGPLAHPAPALDFLHTLPARFRARVGSVGDLNQFERAPAP